MACGSQYEMFIITVSKFHAVYSMMDTQYVPKMEHRYTVDPVRLLRSPHQLQTVHFCTWHTKCTAIRTSKIWDISFGAALKQNVQKSKKNISSAFLWPFYYSPVWQPEVTLLFVFKLQKLGLTYMLLHCIYQWRSRI